MKKLKVHKTKIFEIWFKSICIGLYNYKPYWSTNGVGKQYAMWTNKATINDKCFDFRINFIYYAFNFTIFDMDNIKIIKIIRRANNAKFRRKQD